MDDILNMIGEVMKDKMFSVSTLLLVVVLFMTGLFIFEINHKEEPKIIGKTIIIITTDEKYDLGEENNNDSLLNDN